MERDPITGELIDLERLAAERNAAARARRIRRRLLVASASLTAVVVVAIMVWRLMAASTAAGDDSGVQVPPGVRIRVEVLNATTTPRLARQTTRMLRSRGFDVVGIGNAGEMLDTTLVLDRTGHPEWAELVAAAMEDGAAVEARPDTSRYLDVTVLVGSSWTPPPEALYP